MELEWSASDILARLKAGLKNEDTRIEGSFSMDNMQAVSEELARYNSMLINPCGMRLTCGLTRSSHPEMKITMRSGPGR